MHFRLPSAISDQFLQICLFSSSVSGSERIGNQVATGLDIVICELYVKEMAGIKGLVGLETHSIEQLKRSFNVGH